MVHCLFSLIHGKKEQKVFRPEIGPARGHMVAGPDVAFLPAQDAAHNLHAISAPGPVQLAPRLT